MSSFLIATMPATGHVAPALPIARALVDRGHDVFWYTGAIYRDLIEATGATHLPIAKAYDFGGLGIDEAFPQLTGLTGIAMVRQAMQRVFIDCVPTMLADLQAITAEHRFDAALSEPLFATTRVLHELGGPPWATLGITMLGTYSRDTAPFGPGLFPLTGVRGQIRNTVMNAAHRRILFAPVTRRYEAVRAQVGLPRLGTTFLDSFTSPFLYLQGTVPSFEYPRSDLAPQLHFVGPLLPEPHEGFTAPDWWSELDDSRPVVLVTQGTVATDPRQLLAPAIRALAARDVLVVATSGGPTGPVLDALGGTLPSNTRLEQFVPYDDLMPHVSVLVTNGGYGTMQQALARGVPIVAAGATEDKPETTARVAWSGAGIRIKTQSPKPDQLAEAVDAVLRKPDYRSRAEAIATEMAGYDAPSTCATLLEALANTGTPVLRSTPTTVRAASR